MPTRYFESRTPSSCIMAAGGVLVRWVTFDGEVGWFATDSASAAKSLTDCIERKVGGAIREGTKEEYEAFMGKANGLPVFRRDREALGADGTILRSTLSPASPPPSSPAVAVAAADEAPRAPVTNTPDPVVRSRRRGDEAKS